MMTKRAGHGEDVNNHHDQPSSKMVQAKVKRGQSWQPLTRRRLVLLFLLLATVLQFVQLNRAKIHTVWMIVLGWLTSFRVYDLDWVDAHGSFNFSLQANPSCSKLLDDPSVLKGLALAAHQDWRQRHKQQGSTYQNLRWSRDMTQAEATWAKMIQACHGPTVPTEIQSQLTLRSFMDAVIHCADPNDWRVGGNPQLFGGEFCNAQWHKYMAKAFDSSHRKQQRLFVEAARCALHMEFPLQPPQETTTTALEPPTKTLKAPKRVILLTLALGKRGIQPACRVVATAYPRGWDIVLVKGPFSGLKYKYRDALLALKNVLEADGSAAADETLVLFVDSSDVIMQVSPETVANIFTNQLRQAFVFSGEPFPFPMALFPHSLGIPQHVYSELYETSSQDAILPGTHKYVNTGGWIGLASSALVVLKELVNKEQQHRGRQDKYCHSWGTDQLLGNVAYLHSPHIGLDVDYRIFAADAWGLIDSALTFTSQEGRYCTTKNANATTCPALLHFNGHSSGGGAFDVAFEQLASASQSQCKAGTITVVDNLRRSMTTWEEKDIMSSPLGGCLRGKACFN